MIQMDRLTCRRGPNRPGAKTALLIILLLGFLASLTACDLLGSLAEGFLPARPAARITIASATASPGETIKIKVTIKVLTDAKLAEIQVGPRGALLFDPKVFQVKSIVGLGSFSVLASEIDGAGGRARFAAASLYGGLGEGEILELEVQAIGGAGESSPLKLTEIDLLLDERGNELAPVAITAGKVTISGEFEGD